MTKYAIVIKETGEFYPDPTYEDVNKAIAKVVYLDNYRKQHNMAEREYIIETLIPDREDQHNREWKRWVSMID